MLGLFWRPKSLRQRMEDALGQGAASRPVPARRRTCILHAVSDERGRRWRWRLYESGSGRVIAWGVRRFASAEEALADGRTVHASSWFTSGKGKGKRR